jgi:hypothetical protein
MMIMMTIPTIQRLLSGFNRNAPASVEAIREVESMLKAPLPLDYVDFLLYADGGEGFVGNSYLVLWPTKDLVTLNEAYGFPEFTPGLFAFGSDGGSEAFAFDMRSPSNQAVMVPFVGMALSEIFLIGSNFIKFLERMHLGLGEHTGRD